VGASTFRQVTFSIMTSVAVIEKETTFHLNFRNFQLIRTARFEKCKLLLEYQNYLLSVGQNSNLYSNVAHFFKASVN
jgi:hypothetical protein